jgi:hypothetical protein
MVAPLYRDERQISTENEKYVKVLNGSPKNSGPVKDTFPRFYKKRRPAIVICDPSYYRSERTTDAVW